MPIATIFPKSCRCFKIALQQDYELLIATPSGELQFHPCKNYSFCMLEVHDFYLLTALYNIFLDLIVSKVMIFHINIKGGKREALAKFLVAPPCREA